MHLVPGESDRLSVRLTTKYHAPIRSSVETQTMTGCDRCHTTVPSKHFPKETQLANGDTEVLCMHCRVNAETED